MKTVNDWYNEGVVANREKLYGEAVKCFDEALKLDRNHKESLNAKGSVLFNQGKTDEAIECYDLAIKIDPNYTSPWNSKGMLYMKMGNYEKALMCHEKALNVNPKNETALKAKEKIFELLSKQQQENEKKFDEQLKARRMILEKKNTEQKITFQRTLSSILTKPEVTSSLKDISPELMEELKKQLGEEFKKAMEQLVLSQSYQNEMHQSQRDIFEQIRERDNKIWFEIDRLRKEQDQLRDKQTPLYEKYQRKQRILKEQEDLCSPETIKIFYNTIEKVLGSYFVGAVSLASGMIKREETLIEQGIEATVNIVGKVLDCIPAVGGVAKTIATSAIELSGFVYSMNEDRRQEEGAQNVVDSFIRLKDALAMAEFIARRFAQSYREILMELGISGKDTEALGQIVADRAFQVIQSGELLKINSLSDRIKYLTEVGEKDVLKFMDKIVPKHNSKQSPTFFSKSKPSEQDKQNREIFEEWQRRKLEEQNKRLENLEKQIQAKSNKK